MKLTLENLLGCRLAARDGEIGKVRDFLLDDSLWKLRYLVVETGTWLERRRVLIAPSALGRIDSEWREFRVNLTRDEVERSPSVDTDQPVSRQEEELMRAHYGWPIHWAPEVPLLPEPLHLPQRPRQSLPGDPHLRSFREIVSYRLTHRDETLAKVQDFIIDDHEWRIVSVVVNLGGWLDARMVAVPPDSINEVSWSKRAMVTKLSREDLGSLPLFEFAAPVNGEEQIAYFDYCGRPASHSDREG